MGSSIATARLQTLTASGWLPIGSGSGAVSLPVLTSANNSSNQQSISALDVALATPNPGTSVSGNPTANSFASWALRGSDVSTTFVITGLTGNLYFEGTWDGTNWWPIYAVKQGSTPANQIPVYFCQASGIYQVNTAGMGLVRLRASSSFTPAATVNAYMSSSLSSVALSGPLPPGNNSIGQVTLSGAATTTPSSGVLTAASAVTTTVTTTTAQVTASVSVAGNITFHVATAAFVGSLIFEGSLDGGLNWAPMICIREDGTGADSSVALSTATSFIRQYTVALAGYTHFKVRCSAFTSGAAAIYMVPGPFLIEPNPTLAAGTAQIGSVSLATAASAALGMYGNVNPYGTQRVTIEPTTLFMDAFDGTVIDTNKWVVAGTQTPTQSNGNLTLAVTVGASVNNNATAISLPTFISPGVSFLTFSEVVTLEAAQTNAVNVHRFWGKGQVTSYAYGTPVTDGVGFEVDGATGALQCVVYIAGTKYVVNSTTVANITSSLNGAVPGGVPAGTALPSGAVASAYGKALTWQGGLHRYAMMVRSDVVYWFVEGTDVPVAVLAYVLPNVQQLPLRLASITNPAATSLAHTFLVGGTAVNDNSGQNHTISDPVYQFRRAWVTSGNALQVSPIDGGKATYSVVAVGIAAPSGIFASFVGSATKVCRITRVRVTATGTTAATIDLTLQKTSTAPTGGTATNPTKMPVDSNDVAATATFSAYTVVPTTGTVVGSVGAAKLQAPLAGVALNPTEFTFGSRPGAKGLVLRGNTQAIQLVGSAAIAGASVDIEIEWTEE